MSLFMGRPAAGKAAALPFGAGMATTKKKSRKARWLDSDRHTAAAAKKLQPPWFPIASAPRDGRQFLAVWMDCDCTWNFVIAQWSGSQFLSENGAELGYGLAGWLDFPPLPGKARLK